MLARAVCRRRPVRAAVTKLVLLLALPAVLGPAPGAAQSRTPPAGETDPAPMVLHILDYVAVDYPGAVKDGRVLDEGEYKEQVEFVTQPNFILESGESVLDSLYVVQGSSVPIGTGNVAMTVYHGANGGQCVWTGFDLWSFQRTECIQLVDGVLQGIWGLPRAPVARGPAGAPALSVDGSRAPHGFARMTRALRVHY